MQYFVSPLQTQPNAKVTNEAPDVVTLNSEEETPADGDALVENEEEDKLMDEDPRPASPYLMEFKEKTPPPPPIKLTLKMV